MHKGNTALKVISLLAAVFLWLYVMGEVDPETRTKISNIPVYLTNAEQLADNGLAAVYEEQITVSATVSGKRSVVNQAKNNGLSAYIDVADCEEGSNELKITLNVPANVSLENISSSMMVIQVEKIVSQTKPVVIDFIETDASGDKKPWIIEQSVESVTVTGAESSVKKIKKVRGTIDSAELSENKSTVIKAELTPVNGKGREIYGVEISPDSVEAEAQMLSTKAVKLEITASGGENIDTDKLDIPDNVRLVGKIKDLEGIESVECIVDLDGNGRVNISVELPENIYLLIGEDNGKIIWN